MQQAVDLGYVKYNFSDAVNSDSLASMQLFVTGSTGKVGSRAVRHLAEKGHKLRVLVREDSQAGEARQRGWDAVQGDLSAPNSLQSAISGVDAAVHIAAFFRGATPEQMKVINETGTVELAKAALRANVKRFVYTSTGLVYGEGHGHASLETDGGEPRQPYPQTKLAAEKGISLLKEDGLDPRILRLSFVYGDGDSHLSDWLPRLRELPGNRRVQMVHHLDVCQAIELAVSSENEGTYNVADNELLTVDEVFRSLKVSGGKASEPLSEQQKWEGIMDCRKIREELAFRPRFPSLREAILRGAL